MKLVNLGEGLDHIVDIDSLKDDSIIVDAGANVGLFVVKEEAWRFYEGESPTPDGHFNLSQLCIENNFKIIKEVEPFDDPRHHRLSILKKLPEKE